jgi:hypothetical protein
VIVASDRRETASPATRAGASDRLAPGSAGGTGRIKDAAAQAVATETAGPNRPKCARLSALVLAPRERRSHEQNKRSCGLNALTVNEEDDQAQPQLHITVILKRWVGGSEGSEGSPRCS